MGVGGLFESIFIGREVVVVMVAVIAQSQDPHVSNLCAH
ncbi:protein of unknown function [Pararobbsia alpina]